MLILLTGIIIVHIAPRNGLLGESCFGRSCVKNFGLKCISNICACEAGYEYIDKCILKKTYMQKCHENSICNDTNLICFNGVCSCNSTQYWNNQTCVSKNSKDSKCLSTLQCLDNLMLYCNTLQSICTCPNNR